MDVVYVCRHGENNEELRYSLRSLANVDHDEVWVAGGWPPWLRARTIAVPRPKGGPYAASYANLIAALEHPEVSERFLLMMDDVFIMWPQEIAPMHRGDIARSKVAQSSHRSLILQMGRWLDSQGRGRLDYETHAPFVMDKAKLAEVVALPAPEKARLAAIRTLYGNWHEIGGWPVEDFKVRPPFDIPHRPIISTNDGIFARKEIGLYIRDQFPEPSPYEEAPRDTHEPAEPGGHAPAPGVRRR